LALFSQLERTVMCLRCATGFGPGGELARRVYILQLLALVEHPNALPADAILRLSHELLTLTGSGLKCTKPELASLQATPSVPNF
jgi:hypothetical protein